MISKIFSSHTLQALEKGLDVASLRHEVIANNIANANTPGFKTSGVDFSKVMEGLMESNGVRQPSLYKTHHKHKDPNWLKAQRNPVQRNDSTTMRADGNNVDIDREMTNMAANQMIYNAVTQRVNGKYAMLRYVISDGSR